MDVAGEQCYGAAAPHAPHGHAVGVPIPGRPQWPFSRPEFTERRADRSELELGGSAGAVASSYQTPFAELASSLSPGRDGGWHVGSHEPELSRNLQHIQIDDMWEGVGMGDLIPGSTLAELSAGDDLNELELDPLAAHHMTDLSPGKTTLTIKAEFAEYPVKSEPPCDARLLPSCRPAPGGERRLTLQPAPGWTSERTSLASSAPHASSASLASRLSSSVPGDGLLELRQARLSPPSAFRCVGDARGSGSSVSTGILSPGSHGSFADDGAESQQERGSDSDSDAGSNVGGDESLSQSLGRKERYFWQYNVQAKGPKGQRLQLTPEMADPFQARQPVDPVFSSSFQVDGIQHSGKARRGDGNDLTPSPRKLISIRCDLDKLNRLIDDMTPLSELPLNVRSESRKEKNKLASRVCRLKKKAQHEANKIQLSGLNEEHRRMTATLRDMGQVLRLRLSSSGSAIRPEEAGQLMERLYKQANKGRVAGHLQDYVQRRLERQVAPHGGGGGGGSPPVPVEHG
ncbi:protein CREBRF homolog isoform X2 [Pollicipes pollicipes]|uniref:protein CREBRF homolog isoform X2 n=1 Tax=Pollicipes pollicipes TaxID=41117 RepID=UPI001884D798|nr:protein CREBRF homolog isoform X2 [Pollicipes pollicipes]